MRSHGSLGETSPSCALFGLKLGLFLKTGAGLVRTVPGHCVYLQRQEQEVVRVTQPAASPAVSRSWWQA